MIIIQQFPTLVEQLESTVRTQASLLKCRRCHIPFSLAKNDIVHEKIPAKGKKREKFEFLYPFGAGLVQFMEWSKGD